MFCRETGDKDVRFKVLYCGICHTDLHMAMNDWGITSYPIVPGSVHVYAFHFLLYSSNRLSATSIILHSSSSYPEMVISKNGLVLIRLSHCLEISKDYRFIRTKRKKYQFKEKKWRFVMEDAPTYTCII